MAETKNDETMDAVEDMAPEDMAPEAASQGFAEEESLFVHDRSAEIERLTAERDDMRDRFMRALADAENSRKRSERDRREAASYGGAKFATDMLPVYDSLTRALAAATDEARSAAGPMIEGIELTLRELVNIFSKHGIARIAPEIGTPFDPQQHQAMFEAPVPGSRSGEIIQVMADGFMLHDRLLRPAQVGVSSSPRG